MKPTDVVLFKFRKMLRTGNRQNRALFAGQKLPASQILATAPIAPKIRQGQPQQCTQSVPDFVQIGSLSAEL